MTDTCTPEQRSSVMRRIRSKDTKPEMVVRKLVYSMGYRYRLHVSKLPGKPDIVMAGRRKIIEIRGCFWHQHKNCPFGRMPKSRLDYWQSKLTKNTKRDLLNVDKLTSDGWDVLIIWECETQDIDQLQFKLQSFLQNLD